MYQKILRFGIKCFELLWMLNHRGTRRRDETSNDELLMARYGQLEEKQSIHNEVIHRTFYISIVFWGILIGAWTRMSLILQKAILFVFAFVGFVTMLGWTWSYLNGRSSIKKEKTETRKQMNCSNEEIGLSFSSDTNNSKLPFLSPYTDRLFVLYYAISAILCLLVSVALLQMYQPPF